MFFPKEDQQRAQPARVPTKTVRLPLLFFVTYWLRCL